MVKRNLKVTKVRVEKKHRTIELDNGNVFRISEDVFLSNPLFEGDRVTHELLKKITSQQTEKEVRGAGLRLIKYRPRSRYELYERLIKKGFPKDYVLSALSWFEEYQFIDDTVFAKSFANEKVKNKKIGPIALKAEFFPHRLDEDLVLSVMNEVYKKTPEEDLIRIHIQKKKLDNAESLSKKEFKKLSDFLKRKGFRWDAIRTVFIEHGWL